VFGEAGRLWVAWTEASHIFVSSSADRGATFGPATRVTPEPETVDANGEARPKIAMGAAGELYVAWTRAGEQPFTGDIRFARSTDGGRTFSSPVTVNDDGLPIGHRFETIGVNDAGDIFIVWIDKRDLEAATAAGTPYAGAALYYTWSTDGGATFAPNRKIKDNVCECCRIAVEFDGADLPVLVWRNVFDGSIRDHGIVRFVAMDEFAEIDRVSDDGWKLEGCPHHGPALAIDADGVYHVAWFTGVSPRGPGAFYARSTDQGRTFTPPVRVGSSEMVSHAAIIAVGDRRVLAWKEPLNEGAGIFAVESTGDEDGWSAPREIARTTGRSDHPLLIAREDEVFLSWQTEPEGYRLVPLDSN
jgi:hypothetical protein